MSADSNWSPVEDLSFIPPNSEQIAVAAAGAIVHLVWAQAKTLYHAQQVDGAWTAPVKVAAGEQPTLAVGPDGVLYCALAHLFLGNREIYVTSFAGGKWDLAELVSHTTGASSDPAICAASDGSLHLAWADTTPGYTVIYHATRSGSAWINAPIPNGKGSRPTIAASGGKVFVAWQDRLPSSERQAFDVLASSRSGEDWTLPAMVSDSAATRTRCCRASRPPRRVAVTWSGRRNARACTRSSMLISGPKVGPRRTRYLEPGADARLAFAMPNRWGLFQFLWSEGNVLKHRIRPGEPQSPWKPVEIACEDCAGLSELSAAISTNGELHAVFTRYVNGGERKVQCVRRKAIDRQKVFLPVIGR